MSAAREKSFVIKHIFARVESLDDNHESSGAIKNHFNFHWKVSGLWNGENVFKIYLECLKSPNDADDWSIETNVRSNGLGDIGKLKFSKTNSKIALITLSWDDVIGKLNGSEDLTVEFSLKIENNEENCSRKRKRMFDESAKEFSDVVLVIGDEKFYVNKMFLASHSSYFKSLFFGNFDEAKQSEVEIKDIKAADFQNFLELINGESFVEDHTVDGLLHLADFFDAKTVFERCEQFLVEKSKKSSGEKIQLAIKYKMDYLAEKCISGMKNFADIKSVVPEVEKILEDSVWKKLLMKGLSFK